MRSMFFRSSPCECSRWGRPAVSSGVTELASFSNSPRVCAIGVLGIVELSAVRGAWYTRGSGGRQEERVQSRTDKPANRFLYVRSLKLTQMLDCPMLDVTHDARTR